MSSFFLLVHLHVILMMVLAKTYPGVSHARFYLTDVHFDSFELYNSERQLKSKSNMPSPAVVWS